MEKLEVDQTDVKLLRALQSDARLSYRQVAKRCGLSASTAMTRIRGLEKMGVIEGYTLRLNYEKLGYDITAITEVTISKGAIWKEANEISNHPGVCLFYNITGQADGIIVAKFKNRSELNDFTKWLLSKGFIERTNTHICLSTIKEDLNIL